jgi:hypothetical protein
MEEEHKKNLWGKFKDLFGKEEKPEPEEPKQEPYSMPIPTNTREQKECFFCKASILESDNWSKQQNRWFHRHCYKKFLQAGKRGKL